MTAANYFQLFELAQQFNLDAKLLETNYRKIQSLSHPDRFVNATAAEKMQSMQLATTANEAYRILKKPATRAQYLLELQGIQAISETNTAMPMDFLMQQMEWREQLEEAKSEKNIASLESLIDTLNAESKMIQATLAHLMDTKKDYSNATSETRKLIFIDKVCADVQQALEQLE